MDGMFVALYILQEPLGSSNTHSITTEGMVNRGAILNHAHLAMVQCYVPPSHHFLKSR